MQAVNLLPLEHRPTGRWSAFGSGLTPDRVLRIGGTVTAVIAVSLTALYVYERSVVSSKQHQLADQQAQLASVQSQAQVVKNTQTEVAAEKTVVDSVIAGRMVWDSTLGDLARVLPAGVQLTSLQASAPVPPAPVAPTTPAPTTSGTSSSTSSTTVAPTTPVAPVAPTTTFTITGNAPSHVRVALILDRLALLPWLTDVSLQTSNRLSTGSVQFTVTGVVQKDGGQG